MNNNVAFYLTTVTNRAVKALETYSSFIIGSTMKLFINRIQILFILLFFFMSKNTFAQQKNLNFSIISKGDTVGKMQINQTISGRDSKYSVVSSVTTRLLMTVKVNVQEEAQYHDKKLVASSSRRIINDKPKAYRQTRAMNDSYLVSDDEKTDTLNEKEIVYDFSQLYFREPTGVKQVYSNYYLKQLPLIVLEAHSYEVDLPEGGSNVYYYSNGICTKVDIRSSLFNAQMLLNQ